MTVPTQRLSLSVAKIKFFFFVCSTALDKNPTQRIKQLYKEYKLTGLTHFSAQIQDQSDHPVKQSILKQE